MLITFANFHSLRLASTFSNVTYLQYRDFLLRPTTFVSLVRWLEIPCAIYSKICYIYAIPFSNAFCQYKSGFPNAPGGGITNFDFIVKEMAWWECNFTVDIIDGFHNKNKWLWINNGFNFCKQCSVILHPNYCCGFLIMMPKYSLQIKSAFPISHPWRAMGGFLFQMIQSVFWLSMKCLIFYDPFLQRVLPTPFLFPQSYFHYHIWWI